MERETAEAYRASWDKAFDAVEHVFTFGLEHRALGQIDGALDCVADAGWLR
jgi:hypothetical protein